MTEVHNCVFVLGSKDICESITEGAGNRKGAWSQCWKEPTRDSACCSKGVRSLAGTLGWQLSSCSSIIREKDGFQDMRGCLWWHWQAPEGAADVTRDRKGSQEFIKRGCPKAIDGITHWVQWEKLECPLDVLATGNAK